MTTTLLPWAVANKSTRQILSTHPSRAAARKADRPAGSTIGKTADFVSTSAAASSTSVRRPKTDKSSTSVRVTKKDRARELVAGLVRAEALTVLQSELGMSKAAANTYFYLVRS